MRCGSSGSKDAVNAMRPDAANASLYEHSHGQQRASQGALTDVLYCSRDEECVIRWS